MFVVSVKEGVMEHFSMGIWKGNTFPRDINEDLLVGYIQRDSDYFVRLWKKVRDEGMDVNTYRCLVIDDNDELIMAIFIEGKLITELYNKTFWRKPWMFIN